MTDSQSIRAPARIGFIGIGKMGLPMASNLLKAGFNVVAYDLSGEARAAFETETGARTVASAADVCGDVAAVITMLPDGKAVRQALIGGTGAPAISSASPGTVVIEMSSSSPVDTRALEKELLRHRVDLIDAAVSGTVSGAVAATLTVMCGGTEALLDRVRPVLEAMGKKIIRAGPLGAGHAMKALNNFIVATQFMAGLEALLIGEKFGLDPNLMVDILNASTSRNLVTENVLKQQIVSRKFAAGFWLALMAKDIGNAAQIAQHVGVNAELARRGAELWAEATRALGGQVDFTELYKFLESRQP